MRPSDKRNELRKMIVHHAMDRRVQLRNGNLMTEGQIGLGAPYLV